MGMNGPIQLIAGLLILSLGCTSSSPTPQHIVPSTDSAPQAVDPALPVNDALDSAPNTKALSEPAHVGAPDVYLVVQRVAAVVDAIRRDMGRGSNFDKKLPRMSGASPGEVFYQAKVLYRKANRLAYERTHKFLRRSFNPPPVIKPRHVRRLVVQALARLNAVQAGAKTSVRAARFERDPNKTPTDVLLLTMRVNRQINSMLEQKFLPRDVYRQISLARSHTHKLLSRFPEVALPKLPNYEKEKRPTDVYRRLIRCHDLVGEVSKRYGVSTLSLHVGEVTDVSPGEVFDIASVVVSVLLRTSSSVPHKPSRTQPAALARYPGPKTPSDVYQHAGLLLAELKQLKKKLNVGTQ
jgi:hypothetical protein